jgi:hypothetical protein
MRLLKPPEVNLLFEVSLPRTSEAVTLHVNSVEYTMTPVTDYYFTSEPINAISGDQLNYFYASGDNKTETKTVTVTKAGKVRDGLPWQSSPTYSKPGFIKGHTVMDFGGYIVDSFRNVDNTKITYVRPIKETYRAMRDDGGDWFGYDYYWFYSNYTAPVIEDEAVYYPQWSMTDNDFKLMADQAKAADLDVFLMTELEWVALPEKRAEFGNDYAALMEWQGKYWSEGQKYTQDMGNRFSQNPNDPEAKAYWDSWFAQFEEFMMYSAEQSEKNGIGVLTLGKQVDGAMIPQNEARWRALIAKVRGVYHGKLTQVIWNDENGYQLSSIPWANDLDFITIFYYNTVSDKERPSVEELKAKMDEFNRNQFEPLYERYGKPIVFVTPFQSRTFSAQQDWFEPMAKAPNVGLDYTAQADLYEAFFESVIDEPWCAGVMTWGYWIEGNYDNPEYDNEKSSTVREKMASLVVRKWLAQVGD